MEHTLAGAKPGDPVWFEGAIIGRVGSVGKVAGTDTRVVTVMIDDTIIEEKLGSHLLDSYSIDDGVHVDIVD